MTSCNYIAIHYHIVIIYNFICRLFERLEGIGERALQLYDQPDAGPLGLDYEIEEVHTFSSVMCWVAADRLRMLRQYLRNVYLYVFL